MSRKAETVSHDHMHAIPAVFSLSRPGIPFAGKDQALDPSIEWLAG